MKISETFAAPSTTSYLNIAYLAYLVSDAYNNENIQKVFHWR